MSTDMSTEICVLGGNPEGNKKKGVLSPRHSRTRTYVQNALPELKLPVTVFCRKHSECLRPRDQTKVATHVKQVNAPGVLIVVIHGANNTGGTVEKIRELVTDIRAVIIFMTSNERFGHRNSHAPFLLAASLERGRLVKPGIYRNTVTELLPL